MIHDPHPSSFSFSSHIFAHLNYTMYPAGQHTHAFKPHTYSTQAQLHNSLHMQTAQDLCKAKTNSM